MLEILYDLVIQPIWLLLEIVFKIAYSICDNPGISIVFVSLVVNILVLPLYLKSDALQSEERNKQKEMESWVKHIRKNFKGDERFMMLSEYYRQNDYQPWYVLKSSLSLLLQIPFFIAAYRFLSDLQLLHGVSFLFIKDLGLPDATFSIGSFPVNLLPIAMTVINLVSSVIYTKGGPLREKVQTVGMALIFLVLLYNSPAGLVFYWTLNNLFSLGKNVIMSILGNHGQKEEKSSVKSTDNSGRLIGLVSSIFLSVLIGMIVPISVIGASPLEFIKRGQYVDPTRYILTTTATAAGYFLVWGTVVYYLGTEKFRRVYGTVCLVLAVMCLSNYMFFSDGFGTLFPDLIFSGIVEYSSYDVFMNNLFTLNLALILAVISRKKPGVIIPAISILAISAFIMGSYQTIETSRTVRSSENYKLSTYEVDNYDPVVKLSKTGKNVVVLCLDKAIGRFMPYILNEKPELAHDFDGFKYYPNTVSFGGCTILAAPGMYGGYEYSTWEINQRPDEPLVNKMNESLTLLPVIFSENGYHSSMFDIPYGNFSEKGDLSIYDGINDCEAKNLTTGAYSGLLTEDEKKATDPQHFNRNFFCYSLLKVAPLFLQHLMYDDGKYNALSRNIVPDEFANSYTIMKHLPELTEAVDDDKPQLIVMHNMITHEGVFMDSPDYVLKSYTNDNSTAGKSVTLDGETMLLDNEEQIRHYDSNVCAMLLTAKWLESLKKMGVYDNTRIIIVADHGYHMLQFTDWLYDDIELDVEGIDPLLMVKDFNERGDLTTDDTFMTNGDVPTIAMKDVIEDPVNPYTGNPVNDDKKLEGDLVVTASSVWNTASHEENTYNTGDSHWYTVHDSIFDRDNWALYEP